jgi:putative transposase
VGIGLKGYTPVCQLKNQTHNMYSIANFQAVLQGLPRGVFDRIVKKHNADKYCKRFGHWEHLIAMLYAQLSGTVGLRSLESSFNSHVAHHYHLGTSELKRTTLAKANERRADTVFSEIVVGLMGQVSASVRKDSKELMYLLDSTSVTLKGREFDRWTLENRTRNTQGMKIHVLIDAKSETPTWSCLSAANVNDIEPVNAVPLHRDAVYVFDKGYNDYNWWHRIDDAGARFVTRFKKNAAVIVEKDLPIPDHSKDVVLMDQIVKFKNRSAAGRRNSYYGQELRRIVIARPDKPTPMTLATNDMVSSAAEIAQRYKERWGIEMFFKWVKQHLNIKKFFGRSENAVRIQLLTALISYLLVAIYKKRHAMTQTMWECLAIIRATLFQRRKTEQSVHRRRTQNAAINAKIQPCLF